MGCGSCKTPPPTPRMEETIKPVERLPDRTPPRSPLFISPKAATEFKPRQLPEKVLDDFIVVWLNPSADSDPTATQQTEEQLQELVNNVITYTDPDECYEFINHIENEKVFLVVSGTTVEQFAPKVENASQVDSIYCLASKDEENKIRNANPPGLVGVYSNPSLLCNKVKAGMKRCGHNLKKPVVIQGEQDKIRFMYDQIFREIILNSEEGNLTELFQFCEKNYSSSQKDRKYLQELKKDYSKEKAIYWYTKEGCLYDVLNRALRMRDYETLYEIRDFIHHLHEQIAIALDTTGKDTPTLYRGQAMEKAEFDLMRNNKGKPTYFPNFLSTSGEYKIALDFARQSVQNSNNKGIVKVLFEIKVDQNVYFPFKDITKLSRYSHEKEWLFSMGSAFRIDSIETIVEEIELIKLTSMNDNDEQLTILKEHFQNFVSDKNICLNFARLMHQMANWKGSKKFYKKSLDIETEHSRQAAIYNNLGSVALELEDYDKALKNYEKSLEIEQNEDNTDQKELASTYSNIGTVHYKKKEPDLAIENFQRAIETYNKTLNGDWELMATLYNNIATVLNYRGEHRKALGNNKRCLRIRERILPPLHPSLAIAYNSIACTYYYLQLQPQNEEHASEAEENAKKVLDYATKAVNIDNQALPPDHPQTKLHKNNLERFINEGTNLNQ